MATKRRCSVCGLPGHDKRSHRKAPARARKPTRRNVDFYSDRYGQRHPIKGSDGYDEFLAGEMGFLKDRDAYLRELRASGYAPKGSHHKPTKAKRGKSFRLSGEVQEHRFKPRRKSRLY